MHITRRNLLAGLAASATLPAFPVRGAAQSDLRAQVANMKLLPDGYGRTKIWGFGGTMPGQEVRVVQGDRVRRRLVNDLPQPTSVHWHGIRIDNAMDGASGVTQAAVTPSDTFDYDFVVPDAGTYWYHSHNRSMEQVARGLYGALIVEEPTPPDIDREEVLILDDWRINPDTAQIDGDFSSLHDRSHAGRTGNFIATNGVYGLTKSARKNERMRLRLINAANARIFDLQLAGLEGWIVAFDGMPLETPQRFSENLLLGPAQRADLIVDVAADEGETAYVQAVERGQALPQVAFNISGTASVARRPEPAPLPANTHPMVSLSGATPLKLNMEGGAMSGFRSAAMGGERMSARDLGKMGQMWAFNGVVWQPEDPPIARFSRGENVRLAIRNDTAFPHAMHLHGMHFHEVEADGTMGPLRDTTMVFADQTREIAFVADNPGKWLLHCHMLSHAASGMMSTVEVA